MVFDSGGGEALETGLEVVGEDGDDAEDVGAGLAEGLDDLDAAAAGGDEVLDDDDLLAGLEAALDAVLASVVLGAGANVAHGQAHQVGADGGVGDAGGGGAHEDLGVGVVAPDERDETLFDVRAHLRRGEREAVVAIDGALDAGGPGEGIVGTQKNRAYRQEVAGDEKGGVHGGAGRNWSITGISRTTT